MKPRRPDPQRALPGMAAAPRPKDATPVTLPLEPVGEGTADAWLLRPAGARGAAPKWAPRSLVTRGEGPEAGLFTMPKWVAVERGWAK
ncbi:MAG: hypothetical protein ACOY5Y_07085 [Pseudomonadota bacterium]